MSAEKGRRCTAAMWGSGGEGCRGRIHLALTGSARRSGPARHRSWPDDTIVRCMAEVTSDRAAARRVVLGGDVARRHRYVAYGGMPGLAYLGERFVPRLRAAIGDDIVDLVLRANPARVLRWDPPQGR